MPTEQLTADTRMSQVALDVADLDQMTRFYTDVLLLEPVGQGSGTVSLGRGGHELVVTRTPDLYTGSGDHLVSPAFYLDACGLDPAG